MRLRPYQADCVRAIEDQLRDAGSTLAVLATGLGKTVIFSHVAASWPAGRVLIVAHREELVFQAVRKAEAIMGAAPSVEMGQLRADAAGLFSDSKVVVGSVQTVCQPGRIERFNPDDFGLLIVDEAHHCVPANKTYARIVDHFRRNDRLRLLGVTATPDRADEKAMGAYFETVAFEYGIREGVEDGWLVPIEQQFVVVTGLDFSSVRTTAGDLNEGDLEKVMLSEGPLHKVADSTIQLADKEPTLVFAVSVAHAQQIAEIVNRHHQRYGTGQAVCLHGGTPKEVRRQKLSEFSRGEYQFLVGCGLFLEGFDEPRISVVAMARPTKSRALYAQAIGRGTRTLPGVVVDQEDSLDRMKAIACSSKARLLVIDFVGNAGKHKLVTTADILGGTYDDEVCSDAVEKAKKSGQPVNMMDTLAESAGERQERLRREEEERTRRERLIGKATFTARAVDPFDRRDATPDRRAGFSRGKPATPKQVGWLRKHGINADGWSREQAGEKISEILDHFQKGYCTPKQAQLLERFGEATNVSRAKASVLIDLIKARGWKPLDYDLTRDRWFLKLQDGQWQVGLRDSQVGSVVLSKTFGSEATARQFVLGCMEQPTAQAVPA